MARDGGAEQKSGKDDWTKEEDESGSEEGGGAKA